MKVENILISQPAPKVGSPYADIITKYGVNIDFYPFISVNPVTAREFRSQKIEILDHTAIVFTSKSNIDAFFALCEEIRVTIPDTMKYFCITENVALYLQKYIIYRKRKIFFGNGSVESIITTIGTKHKNETFLIASTDAPKPELVKLFTKSKLKYNSAVFCKTSYTDLKSIDLAKYQIIVLYTPQDVKSLQENYPDFKQGETKFLAFGSNVAKALVDAQLEVNISAPSKEAPSVSQALYLYLENNQ